jgi:hypothetical protein
MALYMTVEAGFELPAGWVDASINVLEYARPGGALRVGLLRALREGKDLEVCVEGRLTEQRRKLPYFELIGKAARTAAGQAAIDVSARHEESAQKTYHRSLCFVLGKQFLVLVASGPEAHREEIDAIFERAATTAALRAPQTSG